MSRPGHAPTVEELETRLGQDEKWLADFQSLLKKNATITESVVKTLDDFDSRVSFLTGNINSLYAKTSSVQREQQNVKKLLNIVDATMQFHGKSQEFENTIRDGNLMHNLDEYLEKMNSLKEAIAFFASHPTYQSQLNHMKSIFETGCEYLQTEFSNQAKLKTINLNPMKIFECLDEDYEMVDDDRPNTLITLKETQQLNAIAAWLLKNSPTSTQYLNYYLNYRSENMLKTLKAISDQLVSSSKVSKTKFIKKALRKAAEKIGDKLEHQSKAELSDSPAQNKESSVAIVLFMFSALLVLLKIETEVCSSIFNNVKLEATLIRQIISDSLNTVLRHNLKVVDSFDGNFETIMPLVKFTAVKHANQIQSLCENTGEVDAYHSLREKIRSKAEKAIGSSVEHLNTDHSSRSVPKDANVHHVTSGTIHFLKLLAQNRPILAYIYSDGRPELQSRFSAAKLLVQVLSALGTNLRDKAGAYQDDSIGALFMLNNLSYLLTALRKDSSIMNILGGDPDHSQVLAFYQSEADEYLNKYLQSWSRVTTVFDDRKAMRHIYSSFNREFDSILEAQRNLCLADASMAPNIRRRIKELVLKPYVEFTSRSHANDNDGEFEVDRQLKYDAETVELIIDRLFDNGY